MSGKVVKGPWPILRHLVEREHAAILRDRAHAALKTLTIAEQLQVSINMYRRRKEAEEK